MYTPYIGKHLPLISPRIHFPLFSERPLPLITPRITFEDLQLVVTRRQTVRDQVDAGSQSRPVQDLETSTSRFGHSPGDGSSPVHSIDPSQHLRQRVRFPIPDEADDPPRHGRDDRIEVESPDNCGWNQSSSHNAEGRDHLSGISSIERSQIISPHFPHDSIPSPAPVRDITSDTRPRKYDKYKVPNGQPGRPNSGGYNLEHKLLQEYRRSMFSKERPGTFAILSAPGWREIEKALQGGK
ncbi:hypothetical protein B0H11DRAFT_1914964 [Mycena galericulata]|nr:hypothetical protein B0H11DRAFT_1914964 [Mycena galericulata]